MKIIMNQDLIYQPDIVGAGRLFMVALKMPPAAPSLPVACPDCVTLLDQTRVPAKSELRKFYFRALRPAKAAKLSFPHPNGPLNVTIEIWSFDDLRQYRKLKGVQLPRRWPLGAALPELKQGQTVTSAKLKAHWKGKDAPGREWLAMSDDLIWSLQPDTTIPRWHWVNITQGCPVHGQEIYRRTPYYPWQNDGGISLRTWNAPVPYRFKVKCPIDGALYPSNDFANGDFTSGDFPDDGIGGGFEHRGHKYGFIAEICQAYCHQIYRVAPACAASYLATGDGRYVHKALVALARLAVEYAYLATMTQHRHRDSVSQVERLGPAPFSEGPCLGGSGFGVYSIDQPGYQMSHADAYDRIFPAIAGDREIIPFLQGKGFNVRTPADVRRFIEENLFAVWQQGAMDGATSSNQPHPQMGFARLAEMLNYRRGREFMDWLYDSDGGKMRYFLTNTFFRDGAPYESTGGYNAMHVAAIGPIIESIEHLRQLRPELYPENQYPNLARSRRYHNLFDFCMHIVNIDRSYPQVGDGGDHPQYRRQNRIAWSDASAEAFEHAYKIFRDPKFAWALIRSGWQPSVDFPFSRDEIEQAAAKWPDDWNDASCLQDGYGLALLRSGKGDHKRALWMMYGRARGHIHDDIMHIGLDAFQSKILGHLGYPRNWSYWEPCWMTQILARQLPFVEMTATAQLLHDAGPVHLGEAYAQAFSDQVAAGKGYELDPANWQRRMLAMIDVDDRQFYCLDLYRIHGGREHWWTFHAQEGDFATQGLELQKQAGGTLAGPDVPYGDDQWLKEHGCTSSCYGWAGRMFPFPHLYNVARAAPSGVWSAEWALKNADGLRFRLTVPSAQGAEAVICDGKSPAGGSPYEMKWVLLHKTEPAPAKTQIVSLMELYRDNPVIKSVRPLALSGGDESGLPACGLVVELEGYTDTIFAAADGAVARVAAGGFEFAGRFGLYREAGGRPEQIVLIGGARLLKNGVGITQANAEYRGRITRVDRETETITVAPAPPDPAALQGAYIYLTNPVRRLAYKVLAAAATGADATLRLEFDSRIGTGKVTGVDGLKILTATPFALRGYRYYHGARIVNAARTAEYRLAGIAEFALLDATAQPEISAGRLAAEFPKDSWFDVYDYGVGDEVLALNAVRVSRGGPDGYEVHAAGKFATVLPTGKGAGVK